MSQGGPAVVQGLSLLQVDFTEALDGAEQGPATSDPIRGGWGRGLAGRRRRRRSR